MRDKNSKVEPSTEIYSNNGVWCDVYKLTKLKEKDIEFRIVKEHWDYLKRRLYAQDITKMEYKKRMSQNKIYCRLFKSKINTLFSKKNIEKYIIWSASKIILEKEWVLPLSKCIFEGIEVTTFYMPEEYLKTHYGESYKLLPDDNLRRIGINNIVILTDMLNKK